VHVGAPQPAEQVGRQLLRDLGHHLARLGIDDLLGQQHAKDVTPLDAAVEHVVRQLEIASRVEQAQHVLVAAVAECAQQRRGRELLLLVDVDEDHVVDVHRELDPGAAERDDPRGEELRPVRVNRLLEHHARRAVQLADDDPLGPVDDEGAEIGEQRQVTEVDFLLDDVLGPALLVLDLLPYHEAQRRLERRRVGHVALDAFLNAVLRLAQGVVDELQGELVVHVGDGEHLVEHALETDVLALLRGGISLQQAAECPQLHIQHVGHGHRRRQLAEADRGDLAIAVVGGVARISQDG
jgi:hypothetical protein